MAAVASPQLMSQGAALAEFDGSLHCSFALYDQSAVIPPLSRSGTVQLEEVMQCLLEVVHSPA